MFKPSTLHFVPLLKIHSNAKNVCITNIEVNNKGEQNVRLPYDGHVIVNPEFGPVFSLADIIRWHAFVNKKQLLEI